MDIIPINSDNREEIDAYIREEWGGPIIVTLGNAYDSSDLPGFYAEENGILLGAILYRIDGTSYEVAVLFSIEENRGIGSALLNCVIKTAKEKGCKRVWLVTSNDNIHAIRYYQRFGFVLKEVHINSFDAIRKIKPCIPLTGIDGIPLAHEFEFEWRI